VWSRRPRKPRPSTNHAANGHVYVATQPTDRVR
jgi:hypothetical protein